MIFKKIRFIYYILSFIPVIISLIFSNIWGMGFPNDILITITALLNTLAIICANKFIDYDFNKNSSIRIKKNYIFTKIIILIIPIVIQMILLLIKFYKINIEFNIAILSAVGLIILITGVFLPYIEQNQTIGIKLKWTLNDNDNWKKTHSFSAYVWIIGGLAMIVGSILNNSWILFSAIAMIIFLPISYSYIYYKKNN